MFSFLIQRIEPYVVCAEFTALMNFNQRDEGRSGTNELETQHGHVPRCHILYLDRSTINKVCTHETLLPEKPDA